MPSSGNRTIPLSPNSRLRSPDVSIQPQPFNGLNRKAKKISVIPSNTRNTVTNADSAAKPANGYHNISPPVRVASTADVQDQADSRLPLPTEVTIFAIPLKSNKMPSRISTASAVATGKI